MESVYQINREWDFLCIHAMVDLHEIHLNNDTRPGNPAWHRTQSLRKWTCTHQYREITWKLLSDRRHPIMLQVSNHIKSTPENQKHLAILCFAHLKLAPSFHLNWNNNQWCVFSHMPLEGRQSQISINPGTEQSHQRATEGTSFLANLETAFDEIETTQIRIIMTQQQQQQQQQRRQRPRPRPRLRLRLWLRLRLRLRLRLLLLLLLIPPPPLPLPPPSPF